MVLDTQFQLGVKPIRRNSKADWERVWSMATSNQLLEVEPNIRVVHYRTLRTIASDYSQPPAIVRRVQVFWGSTGTGKSKTAWEELGLDSYCKDPRSKFWDGYRGQRHVIFDEFRGSIDIAHILRWTDRYPVNVEIKGSSVPLLATDLIFTSNLHPRDWYPDLDAETLAALLRRFTIKHFVSL